MTYEQHKAAYEIHHKKAEELLNSPYMPSKYDSPKKGTKAYEIGKQQMEESDKAQFHYSAMLKLKTN